ncbi:MAG: hypothetical protein F6J87_19665 [Spirulina sp. SIO3F2]|nr:hypothetical protein [Spirulina sp. SIO3F2]
MSQRFDLPDGGYVESTQTFRYYQPQPKPSPSSSNDDRPSLSHPSYFLGFLLVIFLAFMMGVSD